MRWRLICLAAWLALTVGGSIDAAAARRARSAAHARAAPPTPAEDIAYGRRDDVMRFAAEFATRHDANLDVVERQLAQARHVSAVARLVMPPPVGAAKNWAAYRARFVEPQRIAAGVAFWRANESWLARAEERFGVPPQIVVGIVGVETFYGRVLGNFRVIDALATLAFDFPAGRSDRSAYFRGELEQLLLWCAREDRDPLSVRGSFAGAIGLPQFMPGSINRHAIDFDGDGRIDLVGSAADVIGSVANYLAAFGWQRGMRTHFAVRPPADPADLALLLAPDIKPSFTAQQFAEHGAVLDEPGTRHAGPLALVELQNGAAAPSHVAGSDNFYAVTRYNWSSYYAMAVIELGEAVNQAHRN